MVKSAVFLGSIALALIAVAGARAEERVAPAFVLVAPQKALALSGEVGPEFDVRSREMMRDPVAMPILAGALGVAGLVQLRRARNKSTRR